MYLLGFASVWTAVALVSASVAAYMYFAHDWDRAFEKELHVSRAVEN
jgi:hypothetical protein